jgi:hypothetical protein
VAQTIRAGQYENRQRHRPTRISLRAGATSDGASRLRPPEAPRRQRRFDDSGSLF